MDQQQLTAFVQTVVNSDNPPEHLKNLVGKYRNAVSVRQAAESTVKHADIALKNAENSLQRALGAEEILLNLLVEAHANGSAQH